jgi:2-amino-4-hydroxy-6-hydroxymethyldihydropteridine diphosphokinase
VILVGIGSNLAHPPAVSPRATAQAALGAFPAVGIEVVARSGWYLTEPVPASDQPWFVNAVAILVSDLKPQALLDRLFSIEAAFGRSRSVPNAARTLDLDLLDYDALRCDTATLILPHPRLHQRLFVLAPLSEIAPGWCHPTLGLDADELINRLPPGQHIARLGL